MVDDNIDPGMNHAGGKDPAKRTGSRLEIREHCMIRGLNRPYDLQADVKVG